ncbi:hypothetical protein JAAARDRAFT_39947, partial [Jaapia argillacea MUCL 33604]
IQLQLGEKKGRDHHWEHMVENPCQPMPTPYAQRFHKPMPPFKSVTKLPLSADEEESSHNYQSEVDYSLTDTPMSGHRCSGWRGGLCGRSAVMVDDDASPDVRSIRYA